MKKLFLIPARGGSKGLPRKNILPLAGRPMIYYTLDAAIEVAKPSDIVCVSTDDKEVIQKVKDYGMDVPFVRPAKYASDTASSEDVIRHAINWYEKIFQYFDFVVLLQVTSPLRNAKHIRDALEIYTENIDMVASVKITDANPYYLLKEVDDHGFLQPSKKMGNFKRRQDCPEVYQLNGAIYIVNTKSLKLKPMTQFKKIKGFLMDKKSSVDIDDEADFKLAEYLLNNNSELIQG